MNPRALDLLRRTVPRPVRNALRDPRATTRWLWNEASFRLRPPPVVSVRDDWRLAVHPSAEADFRLFRTDDDSRAELDAFVAHTRPGMILFDAGANNGLFALAALHYGGPEAQAVAIEPSATVVRVLRANLALSKVAARVAVIEAALGAETGRLTMLTTGASGSHYLLPALEPRPDTVSIVQTTLAEVARQTGLTPTHLKIDVEGFEGEVLEGGRALLRAHRPVVYLELHGAILRGRGRDPAGVLDLLAEEGYRTLLHHNRPIAPAEAVPMEIARLVCLPE